MGFVKERLFKIFLAVAGLVSATIVSSGKLSAGQNEAGLVAKGHCAPTSANCGRTASGTILYGSWYESVSTSLD